MTWSACLVAAAVISPATLRLSDGRDLWAHAAGYAVHGALTFAAVRRTGAGLAASAGMTVVLSSLFGLATEGLQLLVPGREASAADLVADVTGVAFATAASVGWARISARDHGGPS
jgi:VanZ family protein